MDGIRQRLDDLRSRRRERTAPAATPPPPPATLADALGGRELVTSAGPCWFVETPFQAICPDAPDSWPTHLRSAADDPADGLAAGRVAVLDIETGGFAGTPVFLIGVVLPDDGPLRVTQFLARDYPEEAAILAALADALGGRDTWVSFNGKSFDEPFLRDRAVRHRVALPPAPQHVDVLHQARRAWRGQCPNFRLGTLEQWVLGRPRVGDVPSADVPDLFHHFIRTGRAGPLRPVLEHNRIDLVSSVELLLRLAVPA
jgi:uncharacterized protein YprB with RNaseH-like and TPR domain